MNGVELTEDEKLAKAYREAYREANNEICMCGPLANGVFRIKTKSRCTLMERESLRQSLSVLTSWNIKAGY